MARIIWLASFPKSGNTWIRAFLANLFANAVSPLSLDDIGRFAVSSTSRGWFDQAHGGPTIDLGEEQILALRPRVQALLTESSAENVFVKTHSRLARRDGADLIDFNQTAGAIVIVRNPLDIVSSGADHFGISIDEFIDVMMDPDFRTRSDGAHVWEYVGSWSENVASWTATAHTRLHVVRYEDLINQPLLNFRKAAGFLGLEPSRDRLKRALKFSSFTEMRRQERKYGFSEAADHGSGFFRRGKAGAWAEALTGKQVTRITDAHKEMMRKFGYL